MTSLQLFTDSLENEPCLKPQISQLILYQIQRSGSVLESLWQANYKNDTDHLWVNDLNQPHTTHRIYIYKCLTNINMRQKWQFQDTHERYCQLWLYLQNSVDCPLMKFSCSTFDIPCDSDNVKLVVKIGGDNRQR